MRYLGIVRFLPSILALFLASPLMGQTGSLIVPDDGEKQVAGSDPNNRTFSVSICKNAANPDVSLRVEVRDAEGDVADSWDLSGDGDGTGVQSLPAGHTLVAMDVADGDSDKGKVCYDVSTPGPGS